VNLVLLIATIITTMFMGAFYEGAFFPENVEITSLGQMMDGIVQNWTEIFQGLPFCLSIMAILGIHELGHYFAARYHNVPVTLPYFIPMPLSIIGTMGAVIRLKGPVKNKRALLDVGASGPLAGFIVAVPIFLYGLYTSELGPLPVGPFQYEGNSLMYILAKFIVFQRYLPADGVDVYLNQVAWAAWVGMLVTGLNLIPVGQLDGGHVSYALFGKKARRFFLPVIIGLLLLVVFGNTFMWIMWILLLLVFGRMYAEPLDDVTPLDKKRKIIAILTLALFVLVFVPLPFRMISP
jgi:membrane-associated protease RseP (regulator of RpoE activity)